MKERTKFALTGALAGAANGFFGAGGVVAVLHARRGHLDVVADLFVQRAVDFDLAQHAAQLLECDAARPQQARLVQRQRDDRGFHAYAARPAVQDRGDFAVHIAQNVLCRGGGRPSGGICRRRGQRHARRADQVARQRMRRQADAHGVQPARDLVRDAAALGHDHGQRPGPERLGQRPGLRRHRRAQVVDLVEVRDVDDQRVVLRPSLCAEDFCHCFPIQGVCGQSVDGFCGHTHHFALQNQVRGGFNRIFIILWGQHDCFHVLHFH